MARRTDGLRDSKSKSKVDAQIRGKHLDYHEGLSANQVTIILRELGLGDRIDRFNEWMHGQTCPIIARYKKDGTGIEKVIGIYEYDLFRWIENQKKGTPLVWD